MLSLGEFYDLCPALKTYEVGELILNALQCGQRRGGVCVGDSLIRSLTVKGERVDTGRRKLGAVLGDDVKTGINVSLDAGVKVWSGETVPPGDAVLRDIYNE